jgi:F-type H+-transporting ATPase subunit alpha
LARGQRLTELLKQPNYRPIPVEQQVIVLYAAINGYMDETPVDQIARFESELVSTIQQRYPEVVLSIVNEKQITKDNEEALKSALAEFQRDFNQAAAPEAVAVA